jgi:hypothetical protein
LPDNTSGKFALPLSAQLSGQPPIDPDLARIVAAWPGLPESIRLAVLALAEGGRKKS